MDFDSTPIRPQVHDDVREFFAEFERTSNKLDPEVVAEQFATTFMAADPNGVQAVPRDAFIAALPRRRDMFGSIGVRSIRLTGLEQSDLDEHYLLVKTGWLADLGPDEAAFPLSSTFLLHRDGDRLRIVVYLNHLDIVQTIAAKRASRRSK